MRRELFTVGQLIRSGSSNGAVTVLETNDLGKITLCKCATGSIPSSAAGYAVGCLLINTTTGHIYANTGTAASCSFNDIGAVSAGEVSLAEGNILVGNSSGVAAALSAKTDTRILVGNGTTIASVAVSGDATLANTGALTIANNAITAAKINADAVTTAKILDANVTAAKLANGAGWAALLAAGLGASANYTKATDGVQTLLASSASARVALIVVTVTEAFASGDGGQPTFKFGETDTDDKYAATSVLTGATLGAVKVFAGTLTANKALLVTAAAGTGTTETGAISVMAMVLPAAP